MLSVKSPSDVAIELAKRLRQARLSYSWGREELAQRAGVAPSSLKRFELTGEISLQRLLKLCFTLHAIDDFDQVLRTSEPTSMATLEKRLKTRKRGKRKKLHD